MSLQLARFRLASKNLATKVKPVWLGRGIRSVGRGVARIPLGDAIVAAEIAGEFGSALPFVKGISAAVAAGLKRVEAVEENQKGCEALVRVAESIKTALIDTVGNLPETELDEMTRWNLAELEGHIEEIVKDMARLGAKPAWRRFLRKDKYAARVAENKGRLMLTLKIFHTSEVVAIAHAQRTDHIRILDAVQTSGDQLVHCLHSWSESGDDL